jgi:hypothetical protein
MYNSHPSFARQLVGDRHRELERLAGQSRLRREAHQHRRPHR